MKKILFFMFLFSLNTQASNFVELDFTFEEIKFFLFIERHGENEYSYFTKGLEKKISFLSNKSDDEDKVKNLREELENFQIILSEPEKAQNKYLNEIGKLEEMINISSSNGNCIKFKNPNYWESSDEESIINDMIKANQATGNLVKFKDSENLYRLFFLEDRDSYKSATKLKEIKNIPFSFYGENSGEIEINLFACILRPSRPSQKPIMCSTGYKDSILLVIPTEALDQIDDIYELQEFFISIANLF